MIVAQGKMLIKCSLAVSASNEWRAPTASDRRSPCPMVNAVANHGYLPRDGLHISLEDLIVAFTDAINLDPAATALVGQKALTTGNNGTFNLDDLNKHGVIEHDGSLSRADIFFGDNHSFNETIWASTASHFTEPTISIATAAKARKERLKAAEAANPEFSLPADLQQFSFIETALYLSVFGNLNDGNAKTEWVKTLFQEERLPIEEGFKRSDDVITAAGILGLVAKVAVASI
uniref:Heme haloperoxidase family profile domain-containing protein n=1 Tax=Fusarium oxysporum (strain Fo5176) TaxID=660025 RepID=A0A0D2YJB9_FUSOF